MNDFLKAVEQFSEHIYQTTAIFLCNPFDLIEMDMSKFTSNCFFISNHNIGKGTLYKVEDSEFKRNLLEFIKEHPDRVFRGEG